MSRAILATLCCLGALAASAAGAQALPAPPVAVPPVPVPPVPIPSLNLPPAATYTGRPAIAHPLRGIAPTPHNRFMAPNGRAEIHDDAWQTDAYTGRARWAARRW